ncbi:MAG: integrase core domain-containing protein [bacterium]
MKLFLSVFPYKVKCVQTDNGTKLYISTLIREDRKRTSYGERFHRTLREHFIEWNADEPIGINEFNKRLMHFLVWYNTQKPHTALSNSSPLEFMIKHRYPNLLIESNMLWDSTRI